MDVDIEQVREERRWKVIHRWTGILSDRPDVRIDLTWLHVRRRPVDRLQDERFLTAPVTALTPLQQRPNRTRGGELTPRGTGNKGIEVEDGACPARTGKPSKSP